MNRLKPLIMQMKLLTSLLRFRVLVILVVAALSGLQPALSVWIYKHIVDTLTEIFTGQGNREELLKTGIFLLTVSFLLSMSMQVLNSIMQRFKDIWSQKITLKITENLYRKLEKMPYETFENPEMLNMFQLAESQIHYTPIQILDNISRIVQHSIAFTGMCVILISHSWLGLIPAVILAFPGFLIENLFSKKMYSMEKRQTPFMRIQGYFKYLLFSREFAMELSFFHFRKSITTRMMAIGKLLFRQNKRVIKSQVIWQNIIEMVGALAYCGYQILLLLGLSARKYTLGDFTMYTSAFQSIQRDVAGMLFNLSHIYKHTLFISNYYNFLDMPEADTEKGINGSFNKEVCFHNVSFSYPGTDRYVIKNLTLTIKKGDKIGLVGENGSGKSTFVKLLLGYYDNYNGEITIDGTNLREFNKKSLWQIFGVVFQDYQGYYLSARENIAMKVPGERDMPAIAKAARLSGSHDYITSLPRGYNNTLGRIFDEGRELSRGQWQKIAIARCFLRNSSFFIMDEPAASLDPNSEKQIYENFHMHSEGKTSILISHRLSNVNKLHRILVFEEGKLIEEGAHNTLMDIKGKYFELFTKQSSGYLSEEKAAVV